MSRLVSFCVICFIILFNGQIKASSNLIYFIDSVGNKTDSAFFEISEVTAISNCYEEKRPNPLLLLFKKKQRTNKKITAAILAFPFPFGIVGLHRIYLGTAPHVPVVYIGTLGGVFGILPFIDFCVLVLDKDIKRYQENKKIFMWIKEN